MAKNKKTGLFIITILVIGLLGLFATNLVRVRGKSDTELLDFEIRDTTSINKIIISDPHANRIELIKKDNNWVDENGNCVIQNPVHVILETFNRIQFKGYVPENARQNIVNKMMGNHTKVEIFQNNEWVKTWYVGFSTQDHYGTYMQLETPQEKSDLPVIMKVKGLEGIIEPRFFADKRRWKCTEIFSLDKDEIQSVDVRLLDNPKRSFKVLKNKNKYKVFVGGQELKTLDTLMAITYLNNYKKIHFESVNYSLSEKQVDSIKKSKPFCVLTLKEIKSKSNSYKMYRIPFEKKTEDIFGDTVTYNQDRFWCVLPSGDLVKCQYFVFNPLLMGHMYFATKPEDNSK
jgi:hypothetical protein